MTCYESLTSAYRFFGVIGGVELGWVVAKLDNAGPITMRSGVSETRQKFRQGAGDAMRTVNPKKRMAIEVTELYYRANEQIR